VFRERERERENAVRERKKKKNETKKTTLKKSDEREHLRTASKVRAGFATFPMFLLTQISLFCVKCFELCVM